MKKFRTLTQAKRCWWYLVWRDPKKVLPISLPNCAVMLQSWVLWLGLQILNNRVHRVHWACFTVKLQIIFQFLEFFCQSLGMERKRKLEVNYDIENKFSSRRLKTNFLETFQWLNWARGTIIFIELNVRKPCISIAVLNLFVNFAPHTLIHEQNWIEMM